MKRFLVFSYGFTFLVLSFALIGCGAPSVTSVKVDDLTLTVSIAPDPPREGDNVLKIKLLGAAGKPVKAEMVHVTAGMPAMGAMPAMSYKSMADKKGDGFEAPVSLSMGGTWDLLIELHIPDKPHLAVNFKVTTGMKGVNYISGGSGGHEEHGKMEMPAEEAPSVKISPEEEKMIGVRLEKVARRELIKEIRTVGTIAYDPELYIAQEEYLAAVNIDDDDLIEASRKRLELLGLNPAQIEKLKESRDAQANLILPAESAWAYMTLYESDLGVVRQGAPVMIETVAFPGEKFSGKVVAITPVLDAMTRSAKARALIENPGGKLKPGMFANATINVPLGTRLSVSEDAVINTGKRTVVVLARGAGNYFSRDVVLGQKAEGYFEVLSGLKENESIVTSGNFLIDSESRLRTAVGGAHQH